MNTRKYLHVLRSTCGITQGNLVKRVFIVLLVITFHVGAFAQLYFAPRVDYTLPVASTFVSFGDGDFNKDGVTDLVVTNFSGGSASVFIGTGDGTFGSAQNYTTGSGPVGANSIDANNDGNPDLALVNFNSNTVSIFLGDGTGSFAPQQTFATGSGPQAATPGDFNEDGKIDLVVANWLGNTVSILLGNGDGTFVATFAYPTGIKPTGTITADLNNDTHLDLALSNEGGGGITVRFGTGTGTFGAAQNYSTGTRPSVIAVGDFNNDVILDLAVGNINSSTVSILTGTGSSTFNPAVNFSSSGATFVIADDYNADGNLDLAVSNSGNNTVSIYTGSGTGSFSLYQFTTVGSNPSIMRLMMRDLNNDGLLDIVTTNDGGNVMGVLLGNVPPGGPGTSLRFNGSNQEAQLGTWFNQQNFTITMWVKPDVTQVTSATIIDNNHTASRSWTFEQNASVLNQYVFGGVLVNLTANVWQHVALVSSGGTSSIYLNGCLVGSFNTGVINYDGTESLLLGNFGGGGRNWNGELDEVRIFDKALNASQIQNAINGEIPTNFPDLIAYYRMNEGSGNFIYDGTTNAHTGTLLNSPTFQPSDWGLPVPTVTSFSPVSGYIGALVNISGTNFDITPANNAVTFNGILAIVTASTSTSITTTVPAGATTGKISVTVNCLSAQSATDFTVLEKRVITINSQPISTTACEEANTSFALTASGTTNLTYQWQKLAGATFNNINDNGNYSGTKTSTLTINTASNFGSGDYRCEVSGDNATSIFSDTVSLTLNVNTALPEIMPNGNTLTASSGNSYQWFYYDEPISGATSRSLDINIFEYGIYAVEVTSNGCSARSQDFIYLITGDASVYEGLKIYPNPVKDKLIVEADDVETIEIINPLGIRTKPLIEKIDKLYILTITEFNAGQYILRIKIGNQNRYKHVVKH